MAGVEDNKFIASAARLVFLSDRELLRRKGFRGLCGGEWGLCWLCCLRCLLDAKRPYSSILNLKYSKQESVLPCAGGFWWGLAYSIAAWVLWHTTHVDRCACWLLTSPTLTPTRSSFPGSDWPGPHPCASSTYRSLSIYTFTAVYSVSALVVCVLLLLYWMFIFLSNGWLEGTISK